MSADRGEPRAAVPGPGRRRGCTDVLCLLLWLVFVAGWAAVAAFAFWHGDPRLLLHATDSDGVPCGAGDTAAADRPYLAYFDMTRCSAVRDAAVGCATPQACVAQCPADTFNFTTEPCTADVRRRYVCKTGVDATDATRYPDCKKLIDDQLCAGYVIKSVAVLGRCIPNLESADVATDGHILDHKGAPTSLLVSDVQRGADAAGQLSRLRGLGAGAFSDLQNTWWVVVAACVAAALLSMLWIFLLRFVAALLIWAAFLGSLGAVLYGCVFTYLRYDQLRDTAGEDGDGGAFNPVDVFSEGFGSALDQPTLWLVFFCALCVLAVLLLLLLLVLYKRIRVATAVIGQASRAVGSSLSTLLFPLVPVALQLAVVALFLAVALYAASMGDASYAVQLPPSCHCPPFTDGAACTPQEFDRSCRDDACQGGCAFGGYEPHPAAAYLQVYNVVALFWGLFFFSALGELVLAGAFAAWYWTFDKRHDLPRLPLLDSAGRALRYHLGTVAFGSLIIALIRLARVTLDYVYRKTRGVDNCLARAVVCCCRCCLWCFEKFMRFINRNAYIVCAMYGTNFCASARDAFSLLLRNLLRVAAVNSACGVMLLLGRLVITALVTIASFYFLEDRIPIAGLDRFVPTTQHSWVPLATVGVAAFFISSVFFSVYTMAVDTIFLCFLEDLERNDGTPQKPYYMSKSLMKLLGKRNKRDSSHDKGE